jgi:hypothetical protein
MKGVVGFLVGMIGLCFFASISILIPMTMRQNDGLLLFLFMLVVAFVFLNVMVVGFYRMLIHLHESALYPEDAYYYPQRGRVLFFTGYIGLLATLGFVLFLAVLPELMRFRFAGRDIEVLLSLAWFVGWIFFGLMLGGVWAMLRDVHQKLFLNAGARHGADDVDDFDISVKGRPPGSRRNERDTDWPHRPRGARRDQDDGSGERPAAKPWDDA